MLSGGNRSTASAINNKGYIVGSSRTTSTGSDRAVLWFPNGTIKNLSANEPSLPGDISNPSGWTLFSASGINANGYIIGQGSYNGATCAFLLTPSTTY